MSVVYRLLGVLLLVLGLIGLPAVQAIAQVSPALVLSVGNPDRLLGDVSYLTRAAGLPEIGGLVTVMAGPYLEGLDTKKPAGLLVNFQDAEPTGVAFIPVSNFESVRKKLEERNVKLEDMGGGLKKLTLRRDVFVKEQGGWLFISDKASNLANVPQDPSQHLNGLELKYSLAAQINAKSIPPQLKELAVSRLQAEFERNLQRQVNGVPEKNRELVSQWRRRGFENLVALIKDVDQLTVGWGVDSQAGKTYLECNFSALEGTRLARQLASLQERKSAFAGFLLPGSAVTLHYSAAISPEEVESLTGMLKELRASALAQVDDDPGLPNPAARATVKESLGLLMDVLDTTLKKGQLDGGAAIVLSPGSVQFVAGGRVSDGTKVEEAARKLADVAKTRPQFPEVKFDTENYKAVDLHTLSVPVPDREKNARRLLGDRLDVVVGTGPESVYLAFGKECSGLLKKVIDLSAGGTGQTVLPASLNIALTPILELAASLENRPAVSMMADALKNSNGKDRVLVTARGVERGVIYRLEIEEGVLRLIGQAAKIRGAGGGAR